jgi:hypothetical protein
VNCGIYLVITDTVDLGRPDRRTDVTVDILHMIGPYSIGQEWSSKLALLDDSILARALKPSSSERSASNSPR